MFGPLIDTLLRSASLPGGGSGGAFLPKPPVVPPSPRPPVRPPEPGCATLPVTRVPDVPSVGQIHRVSSKK